jgi:hypothetical protein
MDLGEHHFFYACRLIRGRRDLLLKGPKRAGDPLEPLSALPYLGWPPAVTREEEERSLHIEMGGYSSGA